MAVTQPLRRGSIMPGKGKERDYEMVEINAEIKAELVAEREKAELAMAKWRRWAVEQPGTQRPPSPASSGSQSRPHRRSESPISPGRNAEDPSPTTLEDYYATDTLRALKDVELAVDEEVLSRSGRSRQMSTMPRMSDRDNPFIEIAGRLGSRRVRPLVLELVQALGHYIDAVWQLRGLDEPPPWLEAGWNSKVLVAVEEGKLAGFVPKPTQQDASFWNDEVRYSLGDVDEIVGIAKGVGRAFVGAMGKGQYGEVAETNLEGLTRLLNDLEDAVWGDAPPRPTDLAYDLPLDFDPYAIPDKVQPPVEAPRADSVPRKNPEWGPGSLSLEEVGRRRHQEWLASRNAAVAAAA